MPLLIAFACKVELIKTSQLIYYRKYAFLSFFVLGAMLTPPDVITQVFMAMPLIILYEVGIYAGKVFEKKKEDKDGE